jgi:uncharacterized protein (TIGR03382 family)
MCGWSRRSVAGLFAGLLAAVPAVRADLAEPRGFDPSLSGRSSASAAAGAYLAGLPAGDELLETSLTARPPAPFAELLYAGGATVGYDDPPVPFLEHAPQVARPFEGLTLSAGSDRFYPWLILSTPNGPGGGQDAPEQRVRRTLSAPTAHAPAPGSIVLGVLGLAVVLRRNRS